jgi:hypothetical protein
MAKIKQYNLNAHIAAVLFVAIIFTGFYLFRFARQNDQKHPYEPVVNIVNFKDSLEVALFRETLGVFHPLTKIQQDSLVHILGLIQQEQLKELAAPHTSFTFTIGNIERLMMMYIKFIFAYALIMILTYYGVQTLALYRFIKKKQNRASHIELLIRNRFKPITKSFILVVKSIIKGIAYTILFSPGYVLAYALKTKIDTDNYLFMLLLATFTNGLLILYAQKFFTFLNHEDRKGYVQTARVKNLRDSYFDRSLLRSLLRLNKSFKNHLLDHIYINARHQYLSTINEQASFLITGLIIIEMALNIQNHFSYELLQQLLYHNYLVALLMIFAIFLLVKITEIATDYWRYLAEQRIRNE